MKSWFLKKFWLYQASVPTQIQWSDSYVGTSCSLKISSTYYVLGINIQRATAQCNL